MSRDSDLAILDRKNELLEAELEVLWTTLLVNLHMTKQYGHNIVSL